MTDTVTELTLEERIAKLEEIISSNTETIASQVDLLNKIKDAIVPAMEKLESSPIGKMLGI